MAVFGLGIMPYITSSIIMQLLTVVIPSLQHCRSRARSGVKKINQYTRYVTVVLALLQSTGLVFLFHIGPAEHPRHLPAARPSRRPNVALIVLTLTAGTAMIMWLGELITQRGVGNGMSILIFTSVISSLPGEGTQIWGPGGNGKFVRDPAAGLAIIVAVVFMDQGQRRIPVQYAEAGRGPQDDRRRQHLPAAEGEPGRRHPDHLRDLGDVLPDAAGQRRSTSRVPGSSTRYFNEPQSLVYMVSLATLIVFFAYFYTAIQFDPVKQADNIRKQGGFIPGIRPGAPTANYLNDILVRITLPGSLFLAAIALIPTIVLATWGSTQFPFGGTSVLIAVGVALETMKQIESQLLMRHYEGFLK